jgi:hypothetical protein
MKLLSYLLVFGSTTILLATYTIAWPSPYPDIKSLSITFDQFFDIIYLLGVFIPGISYFLILNPIKFSEYLKPENSEFVIKHLSNTSFNLLVIGWLNVLITFSVIWADMRPERLLPGMSISCTPIIYSVICMGFAQATIGFIEKNAISKRG